MNKTPETILPYGEGDRKSKQVKSMFDSIAHKYDFLNHVLSFRQDKRWRKKAVLSLLKDAPECILDIATGTGDFALEAWKHLHPSKIIGADLSAGMMEVAKLKVKKAGLDTHIQFEVQDCTALTFKENTFDAVIIAFGVRNFENIALGVSEMQRVLKPGGKLVILELSRPERFPMKQLFELYSVTVLPLAGRFFSKDDKAYEYLPASIQVVPQSVEMLAILETQGFENTNFKTFTLGVCTLYTGTKPQKVKI